jgi:membrane-bound lytic murein transglycosylase MltF
MMKIVTVSCAMLVFASGCGPTEDNTQDQSPTQPAPEPQAVTENILPEEGDEQDSAETLSSLEDLLPEEFSVVTERWQGDLDGMAERHAVRVLVVGGGPQFFYLNGKPRGIMVELLIRFQKLLNEELGRGLHAVEVIPMPVSRDRLIPALIAGQADLIAADLTITQHRSELVDFSLPLARDVDEVLVLSPGSSADIGSIDDFAGRSVYVRESSSFFEHLMALNEIFAARGLDPIQIESANELLRTQDILEMVNAGLVSATVLNEYQAKYWRQIFPEIEVRDDLVTNAGGEIAWVFRKDSPQMAEFVNKFVRQHREGTLIGNVLINRYLDNAQWVHDATSDDNLERLRPYMDLFRMGGETARLDPLMLVAQAYQESKFDHNTTSPAGAVGMMQIKPSTAADKNVGIDDVTDLASNIRAGAIYLRFLMDRYYADDDMQGIHQWLFALAAYNAGPAKIQRIRRQAAAEGHNPNRWLENVELVAARQIGRETVNYVRNIFKFYIAYRMAWEKQRLRREIGDMQKPDGDPAEPLK